MEGLLRLMHGNGQAAQMRIQVLDLIEAGGDAHPFLRQILDQHTQLAGHGAQGEQALLNAIKLARFYIETIRRLVHQRQGFIGGD